MSKREIVFRIQVPHVPKKRWLIAGGSASLLVGVFAYAATTWPANFMTGQPISSGDLKFYLNDLNTRVTAITAAPTFAPLTLLNSWVPDTPPYYPPGYTKTADGFVHLHGLAKSGATANGTALANPLPSGYRPASTLEFAIPGATAGGSAVIDVDPTGNLKVYGLASTSAYVGFDGIVFFADGN
jgi:hypothetical protein